MLRELPLPEGSGFVWVDLLRDDRSLLADVVEGPTACTPGQTSGWNAPPAS